MKRRIDFVIVGAQKAGTTALHEFLGSPYNLDAPDQRDALLQSAFVDGFPSSRLAFSKATVISSSVSPLSEP